MNTLTEEQRNEVKSLVCDYLGKFTRDLANVLPKPRKIFNSRGECYAVEEPEWAAQLRENLKSYSEMCAREAAWYKNPQTLTALEIQAIESGQMYPAELSKDFLEKIKEVKHDDAN